MQDHLAWTEEETCFFPTWYVFSFLVLFAPSLLPSWNGKHGVFSWIFMIPQPQPLHVQFIPRHLIGLTQTNTEAMI